MKARTIRKRESLGPWLHGVALRIARRARAARRRNTARLIPVESIAAPCAHQAELVDLRGILDEELSLLPDKYRMPVVLCYLEGQTQDQAAGTLGWTKGTVSGRLARAKDLLRHRLVHRGLAPSAGVLAAVLTQEAARAAVPAALVLPTVRATIAATLKGADTGALSGRAALLARQVTKAQHQNAPARGPSALPASSARVSRPRRNARPTGLLTPLTSPAERRPRLLQAIARAFPSSELTPNEGDLSGNRAGSGDPRTTFAPRSATRVRC